MTTPGPMKTCLACQATKPETAFAWRNRARGIRQRRCRPCTASQRKIDRHELKKKYGMTARQYDDMLEAQGGVCKLCGKPETVMHGDKLLRLSVDHNHEHCPTRRGCIECVRSLLCQSCNRLVGRIEANPQLALRALAYIKSHQN